MSPNHLLTDTFQSHNWHFLPWIAGERLESCSRKASFKHEKTTSFSLIKLILELLIIFTKCLEMETEEERAHRRHHVQLRVADSGHGRTRFWWYAGASAWWLRSVLFCALPSTFSLLFAPSKMDPMYAECFMFTCFAFVLVWFWFVVYVIFGSRFLTGFLGVMRFWLRLSWFLLRLNGDSLWSFGR